MAEPSGYSYGDVPPQRHQYGGSRPPRRNRTLIIVLLCVAIGVMVAAIVITVAWQHQVDELLPSSSSGDLRREFSADAGDVESIEVTGSIEQIRIERSDGDEVEVRQYANSGFRDAYLASMAMDGSRLVVRSGLRGNPMSCVGNLWSASSRIVLSIPDGCMPDIIATTDSGSMTAQDVEAVDVALTCTSGSCEATGLDCQKLEVGSVSGGSNARHIFCESLSVTSTSGTASADDISAKQEARVSAVSGSADFTGSAEQVAVSSTSGGVRAEVGEARTVEAETTSGSINVDILDADELQSVSCKSVSGSVNLGLPEHTAVNVAFDSVSGSLLTYGADGIELSTDGIPVRFATTSGTASLHTT